MCLSFMVMHIGLRAVGRHKCRHKQDKDLQHVGQMQIFMYHFKYIYYTDAKRVQANTFYLWSLSLVRSQMSYLICFVKKTLTRAA